MARDRSFTISLQDYDSETEFRQAVQQALLDTEAIGHREGGGFINSPLRMELQPKPGDFTDHAGERLRKFVTVGWMFNHTFMPAVRMAEPEPESNGVGPDWDEEEIDAREIDQNPEDIDGGPEEDFVGVGNIAEQVAAARDEPVESE
jgi:hypothetical protein